MEKPVGVLIDNIKGNESVVKKHCRLFFLLVGKSINHLISSALKALHVTAVVKAASTLD